MKKYSADAIRNVCLVGHGGVGKTSLAEAICYTAKTTAKLGKVDVGTSVFDGRSDEKERKMTISMTPGFAEWQDVKVNLLNVPGFLDFGGEVSVALRVVETAVVVIDAVAGVQVGTEVSYRVVKESGVARLLFVNGMDKENADFEKTLDSIRQKFGSSVAPLTIPVGASAGFKGVVDLTTREAFEYAPEGNGIGKKVEIPPAMKDEVDAARAALMESVAGSDEELLNAFIEKGELSEQQLRRGLARGVAEGQVYPLLCGSAVLNMGTDQLLSAIVSLCPPASSRKEVEVLDGEQARKFPCSESGPFAAFVFKTLSEEHLGEVTILRVFSGKLAPAQDMYNTGRGSSERAGALFAVVGHDRRDAEELRAGDIGAVLKLKDTHTSDTLADKTARYQFRKLSFPEPLVGVAISSRNKGDEDKLSLGLAKLREEDPTFKYGFQGDVHQSILSAMGDIHLEVVLGQLKNRFKVEVDRKPTKISYRETITKTVKYTDYTHRKQTGGAGQFARVAIDLEPLPRGSGYEFVDRIVGGVIDQSFRPSVDKGVQTKLKEGILAGYPIVDVRVSLVDGKTHPVDSKDIAFQVAGREAFKKAFESASPILLEPIVDLKVTVPDDYTGDVMGDLSSRRGRIGGMEPGSGYQVINAKVPEAEVLTYAQSLRSITQGRGFFSRTFSHYEPVPPEVARRIVEESQKEQVEAS